MTQWLSLLILIAGSFAASWAGIRALLPYLRQRAILDVPNERSNHTVPTPRGGGIAVVGSALMFLGAAHIPGAILLGALILALVSWQDDTRGVSAHTRLIIQFLVAVFAWLALPGHLPHGWLWVEPPLAVLLWMWFTNLYNFMDGINEITASQTVCMALGIAMVYIASPTFPFLIVIYGLVIAAAISAFWFFNRTPARIFLGDVGSIPLGFLMGYLLLSLAVSGLWAAALILPAYYLADSGVTLLRRFRRRENLMQAHSEHYYQQAVAAGMSHSAVTRRIACLNILLIGLAALSTHATLPALAIAYGLTGALLYHFRRRPSHVV